MNKIKEFVVDFTSTFLNFIYIAISCTLHLSYHVLDALYKFIVNVIRPAFIELLADISMIGLIITETYYSITSKVYV